MAPMTPYWTQPSHPDIQEVIIKNDGEFTSKSFSTIAVPPFGLYTKMTFPPCTIAEGASYSTVQIGRDKHLELNSDLLYINHSCEPSMIFDTANLNILAGPKGLQPGEELTFFYPSTEWEMAQPFDCFCAKPTCRGRITGAKAMAADQLEGVWLNGHIRELLEARGAAVGATPENGATANADLLAHDTEDPTAEALRDALRHAEKVVQAARLALISYVGSLPATTAATTIFTASNGSGSGKPGSAAGKGRAGGHLHGVASGGVACGVATGGLRRGPTSRELSGEMGGDTTMRA